MDLSISEFNIRYNDIFEIYGMFNGDKERNGRKVKRTLEDTISEAKKQGLDIVPTKKIKKNSLFKK